MLEEKRRDHETEPIEKPRGFMLRITYWLSRRNFAAVIAPLKVICARAPGILRQSWGLAQAGEITFVNAVENFHNLCGIRLGLEADGLCALVQQRSGR